MFRFPRNKLRRTGALIRMASSEASVRLEVRFSFSRVQKLMRLLYDTLSFLLLKLARLGEVCLSMDRKMSAERKV